MSGWLYIIRNQDLYKIGITRNFESRMRQLKPDNVVAKLYTSDFKKLERELHHRYKLFRIPQTEYFRLENYHLKEIKQRISNLDFPVTLFSWIFIKSLLITILTFLLVLIFLSLNINDKNNIILMSILFMEKILFGYSFLSLFCRSREFLSFKSELKCRVSKFFFFIIFALFFRFASILLQ